MLHKRKPHTGTLCISTLRVTAPVAGTVPESLHRGPGLRKQCRHNLSTPSTTQIFETTTVSSMVLDSHSKAAAGTCTSRSLSVPTSTPAHLHLSACESKALILMGRNRSRGDPVLQRLALPHAADRRQTGKGSGGESFSRAGAWGQTAIIQRCLSDGRKVNADFVYAVKAACAKTWGAMLSVNVVVLPSPGEDVPSCSESQPVLRASHPLSINTSGPFGWRTTQPKMFTSCQSVEEPTHSVIANTKRKATAGVIFSKSFLPARLFIAFVRARDQQQHAGFCSSMVLQLAWEQQASSGAYSQQRLRPSMGLPKILTQVRWKLSTEMELAQDAEGDAGDASWHSWHLQGQAKMLA
ncbi:hypothetical protein Anapl_03066 [Anas platyrhynchos]|uniref:Uncharacterized protein n=1 Tax=Anas platyrhynchos TaxID=8839 RepID=R0LT45_ANAPL|nr:hypothetical protein Anapl_03066 [Anas platyrhynchos]